MSEDLEKVIIQLEDALHYAEYPLRNDLEVGFRHSPLSDKEQLQRYQQACEFIAQDLKYALELLNDIWIES